jgi:hypothetical protein
MESNGNIHTGLRTVGEGHIVADNLYDGLLAIIPRSSLSLIILKRKAHIGLGGRDEIENDFLVGRQGFPVALGGDPFPDDLLGYTPIGFHFFVTSYEEDAHHRHGDG